MTQDEKQLARLRVAIETGYLPRDLGLWLLRRVTPSAQRRRRRNELLRAAAATISGSRWARANSLHTLLCALRLGSGVDVDEHLAEAFVIDSERPSSVRQIIAILR